MASNSIAQRAVERSARPLETRQETWTDDFIGTKDQLIAAGVAKEGQFPGDPGSGKTMASYDEHGNPRRHRPVRGACRQPGSICVQRHGSSRFRVAVTVQREEGERRRERRNEADTAERRARATKEAAAAADAEVQRIEKELTDTPAAHEAFRTKAADFLWRALDLFRSAYMNDMNDEAEQKSAWRHTSGFRFDAATKDEFHDVASELYHVVMNSTTTFDPQARTRRLTEARAQVARLDEPLQRFLQRVAAPREAEVLR